MQLPDGHTARPATLADVEAIHALVSRYTVDVVGFADYTLDDVRNDLADPGFDPSAGTWLVHRDDTLVGYGWAAARATGELVDIDVVTPHDALFPWLYTRTLARAEQLAMAGGHPTTMVNQGIYRSDTATRTAAGAHGLTPATVFLRMRIDHGPPQPQTPKPPPAPEPPPGVTLRVGPGDEPFRRTAHAILTESFQDHFAFVPTSFDRWHARLDAESTFDWSQLMVADLDGTPAAMLVANSRFLTTDNCGYVADLGVLPTARGHGIARCLLQTTFHRDHNAGRTGTILHVDSNNPTPALNLYRSVGMHPILTIDMWQRTWPTPTNAP
ncbi:MAG TPA: GNAT family N-acetyltransferase [Actinophytocola sp.]|uniref:GNAT family N-acetyltransferase n=1 Tax=Actinophytocola sp. TaxID=1872138 RepID=UPI002DBCCA52|nr:GNAT family N-acetyltransferase [Actinophytocola sp.]HEU5472403.1 GNAT family N-acetyltransferase [Actinophytocola sp.]